MLQVTYSRLTGGAILFLARATEARIFGEFDG